MTEIIDANVVFNGRIKQVITIKGEIMSNRVAFVAGVVGGALLFRKLARLALKNQIQQIEKSSEVHKLWAQLINWLNDAPFKGYSPEQIGEYYSLQTRYIEQVQKG